MERKIDRRRMLGASAAALVAVAAGDRWATAQPGPMIDPSRYEAYNEAAQKQGQFFWYTCEFDAAWVVLRTFGFDVPLEEQLAIVGQDLSIEPYVRQTGDTFTIYGGDIGRHFSGDYTSSFLARTTAKAMVPLFEHFGLAADPLDDRDGIEAALDAGTLVWMKATVDFLPWQLATWVTPGGETYQTVLGNDHAVVAIGYNADVVVVRDPLGPTDTNWSRAYEYEVPWETFLPVAEAQDFNMLAVGPERTTPVTRIEPTGRAPESGLPDENGG